MLSFIAVVPVLFDLSLSAVSIVPSPRSMASSLLVPGVGSVKAVVAAMVADARVADMVMSSTLLMALALVAAARLWPGRTLNSFRISMNTMT